MKFASQHPKGSLEASNAKAFALETLNVQWSVRKALRHGTDGVKQQGPLLAWKSMATLGHPFRSMLGALQVSSPRISSMQTACSVQLFI